MKQREQKLQSLATYRAKYMKAHMSLPAMIKLRADMERLDDKCFSNDTLKYK